MTWSLEERPPVIKLGEIRITAAAETHLQAHGMTPMALLTRHQAGDFGVLSLAEWSANLRALLTGARVCSAYPVKDQAVVVITDPMPRRCTTLYLAEEVPNP